MEKDPLAFKETNECLPFSPLAVKQINNLARLNINILFLLYYPLRELKAMYEPNFDQYLDWQVITTAGRKGRKETESKTGSQQRNNFLSQIPGLNLICQTIKLPVSRFTTLILFNKKKSLLRSLKNF